MRGGDVETKDKSVSTAVKAIQETVIQQMEAAVCETVVCGYEQLKDQSPVKTGRFRAGWHLEINGRKIQDEAVMDHASRIRLGDKVRICNHVPYGPFLENGDSNQAPRGWVEKTAICLENRMRKILEAIC
jgi:hypothetical protein